MPDIKSLVDQTPESIYRAFMEAFADYSVPVTWSREEFEANNARRGFDPAISLGAFEGGRLIGFALNGRGSWGGEPAAYDMGTGVVPEARGAGLAGMLAERLKETLPAFGIRRWLLEVLRDNAPALTTYERAGFRITRRFECPIGVFCEPGKALPGGIAIEELPAFPREEARAMREWEPSWQNSDDSVARAAGSLVFFGAREWGREDGLASAPSVDSRASRLLGYAVASPSGVIWQLAVERGLRRRGIGAAILRAIAARSKGSIRYINIQSDDVATLGLLARCGVSEGPGQYEMLLEL
jgi:ribosomal protein S18 acetylase RimI-like enzyme